MAAATESAPVRMEEKLERTKEWTRDILMPVGMNTDGRPLATGTALTIPLDEPLYHHHPKLMFRPADNDSDAEAAHLGMPMRRRRSQRDSQRRRNALLKGNEGSRQRRRWENDRLMHVPNAQPPLPSDWEVRPTHTVYYDLPYHLAQFWDQGMREMINERRAAEAVLRRQQLVARQSGTPVPATAPKKKKRTSSRAGKDTTAREPPSSSPTFGMVTRDLRVAVKKSETIKLWVRALEEPVRQYVFAAEAARRALVDELAAATAALVVSSSSAEGDDDDDDDDDDNGCELLSGSAITDTFAVSDEDDEELVFVGRRTLAEKQAQASWKPAHREVDREPVDSGILFDSLGDGETGSFKRWIAHSLSDYYGLTSQSTNLDATNRAVYVCLRDDAIRAEAAPILIPRPMWELFEAP